MILLNTTFSIDSNVVGDFLDIIRDTYIPMAVDSGLYAPLLTEMRVPAEMNMLTDQEARTFALQMRAPSQQVLDAFQTDVLPRLYELLGRTCEAGLAMFESTLDVIHDPAKK